MRLVTKNLGYHRWLLYAYARTNSEADEFLQWLEPYKDRVWVKRHDPVWIGDTIALELRSRDHPLHTLIVLRWG